MASVIIVGGGVIGLISAFLLSNQGCKVTVLERGRAGQESSWAGGGIISPLLPWRYDDAITALSLASQKMYPELLDQLRELSDIDPNYINSGMIMLDTDLNDTPEQWAARYAVNLEKLNHAQIREIAPESADQFETAWWMPEVHQVRNPFLIQLLTQSLRNKGVELIENTEVTELIHNNQQISGVKTKQQDYFADKVVIAGGAWSRKILGDLGTGVDVHPVKGQMMLLKGEPDTIKRIMLVDQRYIIPRKDGHVLVGSTTQHVAFDKNISDNVVEELKLFARETAPELDKMHVKQNWCGLRPGTENGIPYIGQHPEITGLFVCAGHYRNGVVTAPASTQLLCDLICNKALSINPQPYKLEQHFH